jgi:hypothetical protein
LQSYIFLVYCILLKGKTMFDFAPIILPFEEYARPIHEEWDEQKFRYDSLPAGCSSWIEYLESGLWEHPERLRNES